MGTEEENSYKYNEFNQLWGNAMDFVKMLRHEWSKIVFWMALFLLPFSPSSHAAFSLPIIQDNQYNLQCGIARYVCSYLPVMKKDLESSFDQVSLRLLSDGCVQNTLLATSGDNRAVLIDSIIQFHSIPVGMIFSAAHFFPQDFEAYKRYCIYFLSGFSEGVFDSVLSRTTTSEATSKFTIILLSLLLPNPFQNLAFVTLGLVAEHLYELLGEIASNGRYVRPYMDSPGNKFTHQECQDDELTFCQQHWDLIYQIYTYLEPHGQTFRFQLDLLKG